MDLFVAETQERGTQTPTLSGEAIKEEGEYIIKSESLLLHKHEAKTRVGNGVLTLLSYHPVGGCHSRTEIPPVYPSEPRMKEPWSTKT